MDIAYKPETKFVSIFIIKNMKWDANAKSLSNKLSQFSYMMQSLKDVVGRHIIRGIHFAYGLICWGGGTEGDSIFKLKNELYK
jgi:hypothetical protein